MRRWQATQTATIRELSAQIPLHCHWADEVIIDVTLLNTYT